MLDWLVIGGGPHGVHVAARLVGDVGVSRDALRILDDEEFLLARWRRCARNTGMQYLRSPVVHHIDVSSSSLQRFSKSAEGRRFARPFTRPYSRPLLEMFDRHSEAVVERDELEELHVHGRANSLDLLDDHVRVGVEVRSNETPSSPIDAKHVVLALGAPREPLWPDWAIRAAESSSDSTQKGMIRHVFDPEFELEDDSEAAVVAVVGAGISGAQVAVRLARTGRRVLLISRHPLRIHQFDSDPGWQGPRYMAAYSRLADPNERRQRIRKARHRGSIPPDVHAELRRAIAAGQVEHLEGAEVEAADCSGGSVILDVGGRRTEVDRVLLATGFPEHRPGEGWLDEAIEAHELPCAACGYPIVDRGLRWHPRVFVTGPLAELEIGPVSRNLSGAMRAGERIAAVARADLFSREASRSSASSPSQASAQRSSAVSIVGRVAPRATPRDAGLHRDRDA